MKRDPFDSNMGLPLASVTAKFPFVMVKTFLTIVRSTTLGKQNLGLITEIGLVSGPWLGCAIGRGGGLGE